jgi:excisionase family DNA binding protein
MSVIKRVADIVEALTALDRGRPLPPGAKTTTSPDVESRKIVAESLADLPLVLSVQQVQEILAVSKTTAYQLVHTGTIPSIRIGRSFRVTRAALAMFLGLGDELPAIPKA